MKTFSTADSTVTAIVPAAGIGSRMKAEIPKQYLTIGHKTVIEHTLQALLRHPSLEQIIVVLNSDDRYFYTLPIAHHPKIQTTLGGKLRAHSVLAGLQLAEQTGWALVHDAARPCLHIDDLSRLLEIIAPDNMGGILVSPVRDTMKRSDTAQRAIMHTVDRHNLWHALTPQLFPTELLTYCLQRALNENTEVTDEASALEHCGYHPQLILGRSDNIKVTQPEDLALAGFYLNRLTQPHVAET